MLKTRLVPGAVFVLAGVGSAPAQQAFEVSEDGRHLAFTEPRTEAGSIRGGGVYFPSAPDQQVDIRRQIGGLQVADMNGDTLPDVVAVCYISSSFPPYEEWDDMIFYNTGGQIETTPSWISKIEAHTGDVQIGDINADGFPDVVTIHGGGLTSASVRVYLGSPSGPSTTPAYTSATPIPGWGTSGLLIDIDHDSDLDLITTNQGLGAQDPFRPMYIFQNSGGTLSTAPFWSSTEHSIQNGLAAADFDMDGWEDIGVAKWINWRSAIYRNNGGVLEQTPIWTKPDTLGDKGCVFTDFNGDTLPDVAFGGDPATMWANQGAGVMALDWASAAAFQGAQDFRAIDVDNDGDQDLAEIQFSTGRTYIYINRNGTLDSAPTWTHDAPEVGTAIAFGDINADGRLDMVTGYSGDTCIRVFYGVAPPCLADLAEPFGELNFSDVLAFLAAFGASDPAADLAEPFGQWDFSDVVAFLASFGSGCP